MLYQYDITGKTIILDVILYKLEEAGLQDKLKTTPTWDSETLSLNFDGAINQGELDAVINSYTGNEDIMPRICEIYGHPSEVDFRDLDYTIKNLFPKRTFIRGELQKIEWFLEEDFQTLVLTTSYVYDRDAYGFASKRNSLRVWKNKDGSDNFKIKNSEKVYSYMEQIEEGKIRRRNIVNSVQLPVFGFLQEAAMDPENPYGLIPQTVLLLGREFMDHLEPFFQRFIDNSSTVTDMQDPNFGRKTVVVEYERMASNEAAWLNFQPAALGGARILDYLTNEFSI